MGRYTKTVMEMSGDSKGVSAGWRNAEVVLYHEPRPCHKTKGLMFGFMKGRCWWSCSSRMGFPRARKGRTRAKNKEDNIVRQSSLHGGSEEHAGACRHALSAAELKQLRTKPRHSGNYGDDCPSTIPVHVPSPVGLLPPGVLPGSNQDKQRF